MIDFLRRKKEEDRKENRGRWSEIAVDCLAVGAIVQFIYVWDVPLVLSGAAIFGIMVATFFGVTNPIIRFLGFFSFMISFTVSCPRKVPVLIGVFVVFAIITRIFRKRFNI